MYGLPAINSIFVLFFGIMLTLSFAGIEIRDNKKQYTLVFCAFLLLQMFTYLTFGNVFLIRSYPFLIHLPMFLLLRFHYKKNSYMSMIAILSAYLFCTPRRWLGTLTASSWDGNLDVSYLVQILITIPLLYMIMKYITPFIARLQYEKDPLLKFLVFIPILYYLCIYMLAIFSGLPYRHISIVIEFICSIAVIIYFTLSIIYMKMLYQAKELEVKQSLFNIMSDQAEKEIEALRQSQKLTSIYRHDLRHHLNYIKLCISENNATEAMRYISDTCSEIENTKVLPFSECEPVNLILSSYAEKARNESTRIEFEVTATTSDFTNIGTMDLCSLLSNALENALEACMKIEEHEKRCIKLRIYPKNAKLCIDIRNSIQYAPVIFQGLPVATMPGHGFGTKSMAHVIEKNQGIYRFFINEDMFIFQATV